ncbi:hypothetical protein [Floridanema aerugineum]|uniref:Uncharacterized protein n=1 Tax=Floridaenema aerugineum BLCC-F46 TaxID=3153654 RepID=A0ABV4XA02_9CYAN
MTVHILAKVNYLLVAMRFLEAFEMQVSSDRSREIEEAGKLTVGDLSC